MIISFLLRYLKVWTQIHLSFHRERVVKELGLRQGVQYSPERLNDSSSAPNANFAGAWLPSQSYSDAAMSNFFASKLSSAAGDEMHPINVFRHPMSLRRQREALLQCSAKRWSPG